MSWSTEMQALRMEIESSFKDRRQMLLGLQRREYARKESCADFMTALHTAQGEQTRALWAMLGESRRQGRQRFNTLMEGCKAKRREHREILAALFRSSRASLAALRRALEQSGEEWRAMRSRIAAGVGAPH
ncbi:MAG: hypothetical protein HYY96_05405 [Candidatus Tectomicrobia bacterium]|nr:hypothetical protein [Candidatus Tectomicrobia bacterium]